MSLHEVATIYTARMCISIKSYVRISNYCHADLAARCPELPVRVYFVRRFSSVILCCGSLCLFKSVIDPKNCPHMPHLDNLPAIYRMCSLSGLKPVSVTKPPQYVK